MNLGNDILQAVAKGGIENWKTTLRHDERNIRTTPQRRVTKDNMDKCLNAIKGRMTVSQIAEATGMKHDRTYKYMARLVDGGLVIKSQKGQPNLYWRV